MSKLVRSICAALAAALMVMAVTACGGADPKLSGDAVARIGGNVITKAELNHWMSTLLGGDFYETAHVRAPRGLVSEPPNYEMCVARLKTIASALDKNELMTRCRELYSLIREQALMYLIDSDVYLGQDAEQGLKVSSYEVKEAFARLKAEAFPKESEVQQYLAARNWSLSDELFLVKRNLMGSKLLAKVEKELGKAGGEQAIAKYYRASGNKWIAKTSCRTGYVVRGCRQYTRPTSTSTLSPAVVIEAVTRHPQSRGAPDLECKNVPGNGNGPKVVCEPTSQR